MFCFVFWRKSCFTNCTYVRQDIETNTHAQTVISAETMRYRRALYSLHSPLGSNILKSLWRQVNWIVNSKTIQQTANSQTAYSCSFRKIEKP